MKKVLHLTLLLSICLATNVMAQDNSIFPIGKIATNTDNYTGKIWLTILSHADSTFNFNVDQATYAPDSKLDWHIHPGGQILLITEGTGYYQEKGKPIQIVHKGDIIKCNPDIEHWHAATPHNSFTYIAISPAQNGKTIWLQNVTNQEYKSITPPTATVTNVKEEIKKLSQKKWDWMADKNVDSLQVLFDDKCMFVHMGGSWGKDQELDVIKSGNIWYKKAVVYDTKVRLFSNTAILLSDMDLVAMVGGREVTSAFMVTEVYIKENGKWKMGQLTFSHLLRPVKLKNDK